MYNSIKRRFIAYALAVAVLIGAGAYKPQKVDAVALTTTAAVVALVATVMTACGVSYWANTQEDAVSYLGGKLETYLGTLTESYSSLLDWLGINSISDAFAIMNGGILRVPTAIANKILDFVTWFNQQEGVESGGSPVVDGGGYTQFVTNAYIDSGSYVVSALGNDTISISYDSVVGGSSAANCAFYVPVDAGTYNVKVTYSNIVSNNFYNSYFNMAVTSNTSSIGNKYRLNFTVGSNVNVSVASKGMYLYITSTNRPYATTAQFTLKITGVNLSMPPDVTITPSDTVVVPPELTQGQSLAITTTAPIANDDTNEEACQAILDTVVSQNGLSATSTTEGTAIPSAWTWLYDVVSGISNTLNDIYDTILGIPNTIVSGISAALTAAFVPSQAYIDTFIASLYSTFDNHFSILSYPFSLLGTFITKVATIGNSEPILTWPNIYEPFSNVLLIRAGSYNLNTALESPPIANAYSIYMVLVKGIISFEFVAFLYAWFCDVFHMKNDDFANPFDSDDGNDDEDDSEDGDGYDGFYSSY